MGGAPQGFQQMPPQQGYQQPMQQQYQQSQTLVEPAAPQVYAIAPPVALLFLKAKLSAVNVVTRCN